MNDTSMTLRVQQLLLYTNGPFYASPWRAPLNSAIGSDYVTAYRHFDRDHQDSGAAAGPDLFRQHLACLPARVCRSQWTSFTISSVW